jgi:hypothetical protein
MISAITPALSTSPAHETITARLNVPARADNDWPIPTWIRCMLAMRNLDTISACAEQSAVGMAAGQRSALAHSPND